MLHDNFFIRVGIKLSYLEIELLKFFDYRV